MNASAPSSIDSPSSTRSSSLATAKGGAHLPRIVDHSSCLWRTILDAHGREILDCASDQFLDLALSRRLKTIEARELVSLLARAERLGYIEMDVVDHDETACPV